MTLHATLASVSKKYKNLLFENVDPDLVPNTIIYGLIFFILKSNF